MTQKKHRISPEDIDLKELRKKLKELPEHRIRDAKNYLKGDEKICGICIACCNVCLMVFPKGDGRQCSCPCENYIKKDVAHVAQYLLLNLKI